MTSTITKAVDSALEFAIAPSFLRTGIAIRSKLGHWDPAEDTDLTGTVIVITGATSGLGLAAVESFAAMGATIEMVARNVVKAEGVVDRLTALPGSGPIGVVEADLADLDAVEAAAAELSRRHPTIDVLIHNAGALDKDYALAPGGTEQTAASQVLGPFLLTRLLRPAIAASAAGRIVWMSSGGMYSQPLDVDRLEMTEDDYDGTTAYARAKRAQVTLAEMWADRLASDGTVVHAMHPGWADTPGVAASLPTFRKVTGPLLRSPAEGADTLVWLAAADGPPVETTGKFWLDRGPRSIHRLASTRRSDTPAERDRLWAWCEERVAEHGD